MNFSYALMLMVSVFSLCGCSPSSSLENTGLSTTQRVDSPATSGLSGKIEVTGSSTIAPLMTEIAKRFESFHPGVRVNVQMGGSSRGITDARQGLADVGMVSRDLKSDEADLKHFEIARDGVCMIVHADNPIGELNRDQVMGIYTRAITNWEDVGGTDAKIVVVNKAEGRSTLEIFLDYFKLKAEQVQADIVIGDNEQGVKTVSTSPAAIGYVSVGTAQYDKDLGTPIKLLSIDGVDASVATVADRTFPISRTLNLVTKDEPTGLVKQFIDFATSADVHDLVRELAFVPLEN